ncbi:MAG TPA: O-antigen ligase family protein [Thermoanaerobaculia bacterium]|nr:O-antigen ligase family protein [Thermoanaerobaculia bacterium]
MALRVLQLGAIAVVLAATVHPSFDLDRFLVPKELILHVTALVAGAFTYRMRATRIDLFLLGFLGLSLLSVGFTTNGWLAFRAIAVSLSSYLIYRAARTVPQAPLLNALALAVVIACVMALLQAYGVWLPVFAENRAPGGTLGNRNFVGHMSAFGLPLVLLAALRGSRLAPIGATIVTAAFVLTRSRAAWLAGACVVLVFVVGMLWRARDRWRRFGIVALFAIAGGVAAMLIPNTLRWRSDNPYLDSVKNVAAYEEGSGRGRRVQYQRSLRMAAAYPILGVGPGNWPVVYPDYAGRYDPSLDHNEAGVTTNPWPSSDWIAYVSERGFAAALLLAIAMIAIAFKRSDDPLHDVTRFATLAGAGATGALDAVLLLAAPALIVWAALGALETRQEPLEKRARLLTTLLILTFAFALRSAMQLAAIEVSKTNLTAAAKIDPYNYRLRIRLAHRGKRAERCEHARAAHDLFPNAVEARRLAKGCD